jgi:hypothetical protein
MSRHRSPCSEDLPRPATAGATGASLLPLSPGASSSVSKGARSVCAEDGAGRFVPSTCLMNPATSQSLERIDIIDEGDVMCSEWHRQEVMGEEERERERERERW